MTNPDFVALVAAMRTAQREYFRTRSTTALDHSKRLEKQVDDAIRKALDGQGNLFDQDGAT